MNLQIDELVVLDTPGMAFPDAADIFERNMGTSREPGPEDWRRIMEAELNS